MTDRYPNRLGGSGTMGGLSRIDRFEAWLRQRGSAVELDRAIVEQLIAIAGARPVNADHVALAIERARDAGVAIAIEQLGKLLVRCENER